MSDLNAKPITALTGPPFIAIIIDWTLLGILSNQVYFYSQVFPNDRRALKTLVYTVYLLELAQTVLQTAASWKMLASGFGNVDALDEVWLAWLPVCAIGGGVALLVQWFYAHRLAVLSQSKFLTGVIMLTSTISYAGALASGIIGVHAGRFSILLVDYRTQIFAATGVWGGTAAVCDVMITISTTYYLRKQQNRGFRSTQALLSKIIRMTVETGAVTAFFAIFTLTLLRIPSLSGLNYYTAPLYATVDLYAVAMLAVLNSRMNLGTSPDSLSWKQTELPSSIPIAHGREPMVFKNDLIALSGSSQNMSIFVRTQKEVAITADEPQMRYIQKLN